MDRFENRILTYIRENELIREGDSVTLGFSGGADSVCLLTVLHNLKRLLKISIQAVHVNHNLRGAEALRDENYCLSYAGELGVPCEAVSIDVTGYAGEHGLTEEEAGRILRYEVLQEKAAAFAAETATLARDASSKTPTKRETQYRYGEIKANAETATVHNQHGRDHCSESKAGEAVAAAVQRRRALIAVAHHADDQAETVLLNLMRGSGLKGLAGMRPKRDNIIRPLLGVSRADILNYLGSHGISYVDDSTNFENDHTRNRLRNIIIPELKASVNSAASEHITLSAAIIRDADEYIQAEAGRFVDALPQPETGESVIILKINQRELKEKARILRRYVIIEALGRLNVPLKDWGEKHFSEIDEALFKNKGYHVDLPGQVYAENVYKETCLCVRRQIPAGD